VEERERGGGGRGQEGIGWGRRGRKKVERGGRKVEERRGGENDTQGKRKSFIFPSVSSNFISKSELTKSNFTT